MAAGLQQQLVEQLYVGVSPCPQGSGQEGWLLPAHTDSCQPAGRGARGCTSPKGTAEPFRALRGDKGPALRHLPVPRRDGEAARPEPDVPPLPPARPGLYKACKLTPAAPRSLGAGCVSDIPQHGAAAQPRRAAPLRGLRQLRAGGCSVGPR